MNVHINEPKEQTNESEIASIDLIKQRCWDEALYSFGTAYIFVQRANRHRILRRILSFLGIVVPLTMGSIYLSFNTYPQLLAVIFVVAGILGTIQLIASAWSLSAGWEETYTYSLEASAANYSLASRFEKLAQSPVFTFDQFKIAFDLLEVENSIRSEQDTKQGITDKEKRKGMRQALWKYRRPCAQCNSVPMSMHPTNCSVCGNF